MGQCTCSIDNAGTRDEQRTLDRACPVHGDAAEDARVARARRLRSVPDRKE